MSARKHPGPEGRRPVTSATESVAPPRAEPGAVVLVQEHVLGEITHELGNFFHKLYYWAEYLREPPTRKPPPGAAADKAARGASDTSAAQMLESTIRGLEDFLKVTLGYFNPITLSPVRMTASDVVDGLLFQVRTHLNGTPVEVANNAEWNGAAAMVDPGHVSRALEVAVRSLAQQAGAESRLVVRCERSTRRDCTGIEVGFGLEHPSEPSKLFRNAEAGLEWAVAQRILLLHGGELVEHRDATGAQHVTVFIPLQPPIED
jgi:signal transduction histidine kinase